MHRSVIQRRYNLRWRFEFFDGKAPVVGQWDCPATLQRDMAAFQNLTGLARAFIEAKDVRTAVLSYPIHCAGPDFCLFKWEAVGRASMSTLVLKDNKERSFSPYCTTNGLTLVTREIEATFFIDGMTKISARTEADKKFHYAGFGR